MLLINKNKLMEITNELLEKIYERLEQVFFAKTKCKPDNVQMYEDGSFYCSKSWNVSYGGTETEGIHITADDLNSDLDELIKERKAKEEIDRLHNEKKQKENEARYKKEQKEKRKAEYLKLKKEFE